MKILIKTKKRVTSKAILKYWKVPISSPASLGCSPAWHNLWLDKKADPADDDKHEAGQVHLICMMRRETILTILPELRTEFAFFVGELGNHKQRKFLSDWLQNWVKTILTNYLMEVSLFYTFLEVSQFVWNAEDFFVFPYHRWSKTDKSQFHLCRNLERVTKIKSSRTFFFSQLPTWNWQVWASRG